MIPSLRTGMPASANEAIRRRKMSRRARLPANGPILPIRGAEKYDSRTMSAYFASSRHQSPATSPMYGSLGTSSTGCAPRAASVCTKIITLRRYCAFVALQGVIRLAPLSSFSAIIGFEHPSDIDATSYIRFARSITIDGSKGCRGVPTRRTKCMSQ